MVEYSIRSQSFSGAWLRDTNRLGNNDCGLERAGCQFGRKQQVRDECAYEASASVVPDGEITTVFSAVAGPINGQSLVLTPWTNSGGGAVPLGTTLLLNITGSS